MPMTLRDRLHDLTLEVTEALAPGCPICLLLDQCQHRPLDVALHLLKAVTALERTCRCGTRQGHALQHPHGCAASGCTGFTESRHEEGVP